MPEHLEKVRDAFHFELRKDFYKKQNEEERLTLVIWSMAKEFFQQLVNFNESGIDKFTAKK